MDCDTDEGRQNGKDIAEGIAQGITRANRQGVAMGTHFHLVILFIVHWRLRRSWLWNWLVPDIFGLRALTFWESLGLLALSRILFGGFGRGGGSHGPTGKRRHEWWKKPPEKRVEERIPSVVIPQLS